MSLATALGSKVTIVMVTELFGIRGGVVSSGWIGSPVDYDRYAEKQDQFVNDILLVAKSEAEKLGIAASTVHVANEHPATAILERASTLKCDLIVMASHGRRGVKRLLLGSQTAEVLANSHVAVLVVK